MMKRNFFVLLAVVVVALTSLVSTRFVRGDGNEGANYRLDGAWLGQTTGDLQGAKVTYVLSPKGPAGKSAAILFTFVDSDEGPLPPANYFTDCVGEVVMTGPSTLEGTCYAQGMVSVPGGRDQIAYLLVGQATGRFLDKDTMEVTRVLSAYLGPLFGPANQDTDGDLVPDPGEEPLGCAGPFSYIDKRTPVLPFSLCPQE